MNKATLYVRETGWISNRKLAVYSTEITNRTLDCLDLLYNKTNEDALLKAAGGNKWIVRRAIALYNRGLDIRKFNSIYIDPRDFNANMYDIA